MDAIKPDWLTDEFLKNALKDGDESKNIEIKNTEIKYAVPKGENYTTDVLRIKVEFKELNLDENEVKTASIIVKLPVAAAEIYDVVVKREFDIYHEFLAKLSNVFGKNDDSVTAKCLPSLKKYILVLEDLNFIGYKTVNRFEQLDYDHASIVLKNLAKFHAASVKLVESEPDLIKKFGDDLFFFSKDTHETDEEVFKFVDHIYGRSQLKCLGKEVESWPESKEHAEKIFNLAEKVWDIQYGLFELKDGEFYAFNHCDLWTNNLLFKYANGKPESVKFVDFQLLKYCDPVIDIFWLIYSSVKYEIIDKYLDELLRIYLQNLNKYLQKYGCKKRLPEEKFKQSLEEKEIFGFLTSCRQLLFSLVDSEAMVDLKQLNTDDEDYNRFKSYYKSTKFRSVFPKILEHFSRKSWFQNL